MSNEPTDASGTIEAVVEKYADDLIDLRRDLHAHPELSWAEKRTTAVVAERLDRGRARRHACIDGTGLIAEHRRRGARRRAARRPRRAARSTTPPATPWASTHARASRTPAATTCTPPAWSAPALALAEAHARGLLPGRVRLLFQPAEEVMPGGALRLMEAGALDERRPDLHAALRPDPRRRPGRPARGAAHRCRRRARRPADRSRRPHVPSRTSPRTSPSRSASCSPSCPRSCPAGSTRGPGSSVVWGSVRAGSAHNVIPGAGQVAGTVRMLDAVAWADAETLVRGLIDEIVAPYGVTAEVDYKRGVPAGGQRAARPPSSSAAPSSACSAATGRVSTTQSLGGEDFGWYLDARPRRDGPARHPHARRADVRPPPGQPARRRAGDGDRRAGARRGGASAAVGHRPGNNPRNFAGWRPRVDASDALG